MRPSLRRNSPQVREALKKADKIVPPGGDIDGLLEAMSTFRGRTMMLLSAPLGNSVSGLLISTDHADYIAVSEEASPERLAAIVCHEVAHALLGHDHEGSVGKELVSSGLLNGIDASLADSVVAARQAYAHTAETDAETVATYLSIELRRRLMRGGHTYYDERWR